MVTRRHGLLVAFLLAGFAVAGIAVRYRDVRYDRFYLPAFDGHVYAAMAERPGFFTVAPWGYRVLTPWLVSLFPGNDVTPGFFWLTHLGMVAAGGLLFLYLRQLGHGVCASWLAVAVLLLSPPAWAILRYQVLVEPLSLVLEILFLLALEAGAGLACLALLATLGVLNKEFFLLLLPLVCLTRWRLGSRRALLATGLVALPAGLTFLLLWLGWTSMPATPVSGVAFVEGLKTRLGLLSHRPQDLGFLTALGLTALWGAARRRSRPFRLSAAWVLLVTVIPPLLNPFHYSASDLTRLLVYALPPALALALTALDGVLRHMSAPGRCWPQRLSLETAAAGLTVALVALPVVVWDPYRRIDLRSERNAPALWATLRGTLATAKELEQGRPVSFRFEPRPGRGDLPPLLQAVRSRWILREGFGPDLRSGTVEVVLEGPEGRILLPCLRPRAVAVSLEMAGRPGLPIAVFANGSWLGTLVLDRGTTVRQILVPAGTLFRGDNLVTLVPSGDEPPRPRLLALTLAPER